MMTTIIPHNLPADVKKWTTAHVKQFIEANNDQLGLSDDRLYIFTKEEVEGTDLLDFKAKDFCEMGLPFARARRIMILVNALKQDKGLVEAGQKRKGHSSDEDLISRVKKTKLVQYPPSKFADPTVYKSIQQKPEHRILGGRPLEDKDIPPVSLLYGGFGQFLDIVAGHTDVDGFDDVKASELQFAVDAFARSMCGFYEDEYKRRDAGLPLLNRIFAARKDNIFPKLRASAIESTRLEGHYAGDHGMITIADEFKDRITKNSAIPEIQLIGYFAHSFSEGVERHSKELDSERLNAWRVPGLRFTIVGPDVKFYAVLSLGRQFHLVSLTPAFSCIYSASEGNDREALYRVFTAVSVLQAPIFKDTYNHGLFTGDNNEKYLPYVSKLRRWQTASSKSEDYLKFQIQEKFADFQQDRLLYLAKVSGIDGRELIVIKFTRQYCPELHFICATSGHAPALLAYERLPGGWYGIAMEYMADAVPITAYEDIMEYWEVDLRALVEEFHKQGFVHGDLRDANILSGDDGCVKLVDFDWGGKDGEVSYPTPKLNPELLRGRSSKDLRITKTDDLRILEHTLAKIAN